MKIATFNCNSVRQRQDIILDWLAEFEPDVLSLQEIKCVDEQFPREPFEENGWHVESFGQKSYNGVALISRQPLTQVQRGLGLFQPTERECDRRVIAATLSGVRVINTYVPNGTRVGTDKWVYKLAWLERFREFLAAEMARFPNIVWMGDINIAPTPDDVYEPARHLGGVGHHPEEFVRLSSILELGLTDLFRHLTPGPGHYTYWDFFLPNAVKRGLGWRIDTLYGTAPMLARLEECTIDVAPRLLVKPSDHTFVLGTFLDN